MRRRSFLKLVGLATTGAALRMALPIAAAAAASKAVSWGGSLYRSDGSGRVFVSGDAGKSWALHSDLGADYAVSRIAVDRGDHLQATVGYRAWSFKLTLAPNLRSWLTT